MKKKLRFSGLGLAGIFMLAVAFGCLYLAITENNLGAAMLALVLTYFGTDAVFFEGSYVWFNGGLKDRFELWRKRRYWQKKQVFELWLLADSDNKWFSHVPEIAAITERYMRLCGRDWYKESIEQTPQLRTRLGLDPVVNQKRYALALYRKKSPIDTEFLVALKPIPRIFTDHTLLTGYANNYLFKQKKIFDLANPEEAKFAQWSYRIIPMEPEDDVTSL